jgi:phenylacetate-CoA ligase
MVETWRTWNLLHELRANARRTPQALGALQDELLQTAVGHAYRNVPFYQRLWDQCGVRTGDIRGVKDLHRLPIVTSSMVREAAGRGELIARGVAPSGCTYLDTSGSSGASLRVWKRPLEERIRRAVGLRIWFEHGFRWSDITAQFQIKPGPTHPLQQLGISRKTWISTARPMEHQVAQFVSCKADVVVGTARALRQITQALRAAGIEPKRPHIVFCAGELLDPETRGLVQEVLRTDPAGLYGQTEVGYIAWQCERRESFHVNADTHLVEVLREGKPVRPGELGTVVVTDLRARTMPLLRYATGDLAISATGPCPCGRQLPVVRSIEGRVRNSILLESGRVLTTRAIIEHLAGTLALGEYRLYQDALKRFRLELTSVAHNDRTAALDRLGKLLGDVDVSIKTVSPWPVDGTGKTHTVISSVPIDALTMDGLSIDPPRQTAVFAKNGYTGRPRACEVDAS